MPVLLLLGVVAAWVAALIGLPIALGRRTRARPHESSGPVVGFAIAMFGCVMPISLGTELAIVGGFNFAYIPTLFCASTPILVIAGLLLGARIVQATREEEMRRRVDPRPFE